MCGAGAEDGLMRMARQSSMPDDAVGAVCDAIRAELEKQDLTTYIHSILTAYAAKRPADLDAGLALLLRLRCTLPLLPLLASHANDWRQRSTQRSSKTQ